MYKRAGGGSASTIRGMQTKDELVAGPCLLLNHAGIDAVDGATVRSIHGSSLVRTRLEEAGWSSQVEAVTTRLGRTSFAQAYRVRERAGGKVLCESEALLVAWDGAARAKTELAPALRAALEEFEGLDPR